VFRCTRKPSTGNHSQYLAKIIHSVQCGYMEVVQTLSVLWLHSMQYDTVVHCITLQDAQHPANRTHNPQLHTRPVT